MRRSSAGPRIWVAPYSQVGVPSGIRRRIITRITFRSIRTAIPVTTSGTNGDGLWSCSGVTMCRVSRYATAGGLVLTPLSLDQPLKDLQLVLKLLGW
jgi:hypothetical protein